MTTCLEINDKKVSKIVRLELGVDFGDTNGVFGQVKTPTTAWNCHKFEC